MCTSFDRSLRHSLLVGMKSTWSSSELSHIPIIYRWGCSISACTSIFSVVVFLAKCSSFVRWMAALHISRTRNNMIPVRPSPAWSCHNNQCRVLSTFFNWASNLSGSSLVHASLRKGSLPSTSSGLACCIHHLMWFSHIFLFFFFSSISLISNKGYFCAVSLQGCFSIFPLGIMTNLCIQFPVPVHPGWNISYLIQYYLSDLAVWLMNRHGNLPNILLFFCYSNSRS